MLITSFGRSKKLEIPKFSVAVYQPKGFSYPKLAWSDIRDSSGNWTRPRCFIEYLKPVEAYRDALWKLYLEREKEIEQWLSSVDWNCALCCWCPFDRAAQRQLKEHGSFICHTAVIGAFLRHRCGVTIEYDQDRDKMVKFDAT